MDRSPQASPLPTDWPDDAFNLAAPALASSIWELAIRPDAWIRRRSETIEVLDPATVRRRTNVEFVLPGGAIGGQLALPDGAPAGDPQGPRERDPARMPPGPAEGSTWHAVPVGFIPKRPLRRLEVRTGAVKLSTEQVDRLALSLAATWLQGCDQHIRASALEVLVRVIRTDDPAAGAVEAAVSYFPEHARPRARFLANSLRVARPLVFAVKTPLGVPAELTWSVDERNEQDWPLRGCLGLSPLKMLVETPAAARYQPSYHVNFLAPEGFEIEDAGIVPTTSPGRERQSLSELVRDPRFPAERIGMGLTAAHVHIPRAARLGLDAGLIVYLGYERRALPRNAALATVAIALLLLTYAGFSSSVSPGAGGFLLAAPAVLLGAVAGYTAPSSTMHAADRLRAVVLFTMVLAIIGGTLVSLSPDDGACAPVLGGLAVLAGALSLITIAAWRRSAARLDE